MTAFRPTKSQKEYAQRTLLQSLAYTLPTSLADLSESEVQSLPPRARAAHGRISEAICAHRPIRQDDFLKSHFAQREIWNGLDFAMKGFLAEKYRAPKLALARDAFERVAEMADAWMGLLSRDPKSSTYAGEGGLLPFEVWLFLARVHSGFALGKAEDRSTTLQQIESEKEFELLASQEVIQAAMGTVRNAAKKAVALMPATKPTDWPVRQFARSVASIWKALSGKTPTFRNDNRIKKRAAKREFTPFERFCADVLALIPDGYGRPASAPAFARQGVKELRQSADRIAP